MPGILGKKIGMTRLVAEDGVVTPFTVVQCEPNEITQIKTPEKDGYSAIVVGFGKLKKPRKNKKFYHQREFRVENPENFKKGDTVTLEILGDTNTVNFTAISKGKGFQGVVKRHRFNRGPMGHGSCHHRRPGAIGAHTIPARVHKGKKLPGHMGTDKKTYKNVPVVFIDKENHLLGLKGAIPGPKNNLVTISF